MGNKFSRKRPQIDDRYTRPQGLYQHKDVDHKKLRRLIIDSKLAPCYPGAEDAAIDLDECPICFLHYPSLNRSKCCTKGICTECFLQVKSPHSARPTQCPFCKTPSYAVEYRGAKTQEEKGVEQAEEQKVIEAKIRIRRQQELQDEAARLQRLEQVSEGVVATATPAREEAGVSGSATGALPVFTGPNVVDERSPEQMSVADRSWHSWTSLDRQAIGFPQANYLPPVTNDSEATWLTGSQRDDDGRGNSSTVATRNSSSRGVRSSSSSSDLSGQGPVEIPSYRTREEDFDLDLEEIMLMEAIWLSIQEQGSQQVTENSSESSLPSPFTGADFEAHEQQPLSPNETRRRGSVTGGFASAIAALAERQVAGGGPLPSRQPGPQECNGTASSSAHEAGTGTAGQAAGGAERFLLKAEKSNDDGEQQLDSGAVQEPGSVVASNLNRWMRESPSAAEVVNQKSGSSIPSPSELPWEAPAGTTDASADDVHTDAVAAADGPSGDAATILSPAAVPESYEEQIMLAMALSLAEAQGKRASSTGEISEMS